MMSRMLRHIKEGFIGIYRNGAMSVSSATAVLITLSIISVFIIISFNMQEISVGVESDLKIAVLVDFNYESEEELKRIESELNAVAGVSNVEFSNKDAELEFFLSQYSEEEKALYMPEGAVNPMKHAYYVEVSSGEILDSVSNEIRENIIGVSEVNYGGEVTVLLVEFLEAIRFGGLILVVSLSVLAIYLMQNTINLTINARKKEISIMRSVGATNNFIRAPFVFEGIIIGIIGSIVPCIITSVGYYYLYDVTGGAIITEVFDLISPNPFIFYVCLSLVGIGMLVGLVGSFFSVTKNLKVKR